MQIWKSSNKFELKKQKYMSQALILSFWPLLGGRSQALHEKKFLDAQN